MTKVLEKFSSGGCQSSVSHHTNQGYFWSQGWDGILLMLQRDVLVSLVLILMAGLPHQWCSKESCWSVVYSISPLPCQYTHQCSTERCLQSPRVLCCHTTDAPKEGFNCYLAERQYSCVITPLLLQGQVLMVARKAPHTPHQGLPCAKTPQKRCHQCTTTAVQTFVPSMHRERLCMNQQFSSPHLNIIVTSSNPAKICSCSYHKHFIHNQNFWKWNNEVNK